MTRPGQGRFIASLKALINTRPLTYSEEPETPAQADTRQTLDRLHKQVQWNRRLLLALSTAVILRQLILGEPDLLIDLLQALSMK